MKYALPAACVGILAAFSAQAQEENIYANDVVVTASRVPQSREDVLADVTLITQEEIKRSGQSTLVQILQRQPGVEISTTGGMGTSTGVFLRGSNNGHALVLIDGIRQGSVTLGETAFQHIQPSQIDHIEILRGPASSLYGSDAIGGVIQIFTKTGQGVPHPNAAIGYGSYDTRQFEAGYGGQVQDTRFNIQVSQVSSDSFSAIKHQTLQNSDNDPYRNTSVSASLSHSFTENHEIGIQFLDGESHSHFDDSDPSFDARDKHSLQSWSIYSKNRFLPNWQSELRLGLGVDDSTSLSSFGASTFRTEQKQASWQNSIGINIGTLLLGAEWLRQEVSGDADYAVKERTTRSWMAGYIGNFGKHSFQANLRNDDSTQYGSRTTGAINYGYQLTSEWRASIGTGTAFKAPTFNDLYYPLDPWGNVGTPGLKPEESRNREFALHWEKGTQHASATYYDNHVKNLIDWQPNSNGPFSSSPVNIGKARLRGLTLAWDGAVSDLLYRASVDLQKPEDESTGKLLTRRARQHGSLWVGKTFGDLEVGSEIIVSGQRYNDAENDFRLGGYSLVNLTASYRLTPAWSLNARVNNLFDRDYVLATTASVFNLSGPDYNTAGTNVFVGLRWQPNY